MRLFKAEIIVASVSLLVIPYEASNNQSLATSPPSSGPEQASSTKGSDGSPTQLSTHESMTGITSLGTAPGSTGNSSITISADRNHGQKRKSVDDVLDTAHRKSPKKHSCQYS